MGIMTRMVKIFKADIHGVMDQFEDQGLLLKQYLRDMEEALSGKTADLKKMQASREQIQQELNKYSRQRQSLERDLDIAIQRDKDDIARMLIRKIRPLQDLSNEMSLRIENLDHEIEELRDHRDHQKLQYQQIKYRAAGYFQQKERQPRHKEMPSLVSDDLFSEPSRAEIELELMRRKEILRTGGVQ
jgi:phage shock protein A